MPRDLPRITARLESLGLSPLLQHLINGEMEQTEEFYFSTLRTARTVQSLLYSWLWFFPTVKQTISLRLDEDLNKLSIIPRGIPERRGRKGGKL